jgi:hypothetical protein
MICTFLLLKTLVVKEILAIGGDFSVKDYNWLIIMVFFLDLNAHEAVLWRYFKTYEIMGLKNIQQATPLSMHCPY